MNRRRILVVAAVGLCAALWTYACGDGATEPPPPAPDPPRPATVTVAPATVQLTALGATEQLTAEVRDQNGNAMAGAAVSWASSAAAVATVSASGLVTAVANGTATITATAGGASGTATVTVDQSANPDRAVLMTLYETTDGPNWLNNENWLTDAPLRDWYGVDTDASGRVVRLDLSGTWEGWIPHGLSGSIPSVLGNLSNLTRLDLSLNHLTGPIPPELGSLAHLEWLNLSNNGLTGPVPPELGNLADLELLGLADNKLTGRIPSELGSLTRLGQLFLAWNELTGPIPPELGSLADLEWLHLTSNELTGRIPSELADLAKLGQLDVDRNRLTGSVPRNFLDLTELTYFFFHENTGGLCAPGIASFADWLGAMEESEGPFCNESDTDVLESLFEVAGGPAWTNDEGWLGGPVLAGWHGVDVDSLGLVTALDLSRNGLAGRLPGNLGELAQMTELRIAGNTELAGPVPLSLSALSLQTLHYAETGLCTPVDTSFRDWVSTIPSHEGTGNECPAWKLSGTVSHGWGPTFITNGVGPGASYRPRTGSAGGAGRERRVGGLGQTASTTPGVRGVWTDPAVTTPTGRVISAVVEVVDGPDAGRQATSDEDGRYVLEGMRNAGFTVRVMAEGFASVSGVMDLTSDAGLDSLVGLDLAISHELPAAGPAVPFPDTDPEWLQVLAADYPHVYQVANVRVFSDISPTFSREHAEHLKRVYDFFNGLYVRNAGDYYDVYYTTDPEVFLKLNPNPHCQAEIAVGARTVLACYLDYPRWFIIPFQIPDFGTQLHEIGHDFHGRTWPLSYSGDPPSGWFVEGTAMYWEGGVFTDEGSLTVPVPAPYCTNEFQRADQEGTLIPLGELINLGDAFYLDPRETYAPPCMLFNYLEHHEPGVLYAVIDRINSEQIVTNDQLVAALLELTGKSVSELEEVYLSFSRGWP